MADDFGQAIERLRIETPLGPDALLIDALVGTEGTRQRSTPGRSAFTPSFKSIPRAISASARATFNRDDVLTRGRHPHACGAKQPAEELASRNPALQALELS